MLVSQQPGLGGAERLALGALPLMPLIDATVVAPKEQCQLASRLGVRQLELSLPRVRSRLVGPLRLLSHSIQLKRLAKSLDAQVVYANASRAMGYGLGVRLLGGPPLLVHNHHMLRPQDVTLMEGGFLHRGRLVRALERWADVIVVPSNAAAQPFGRHEKVRVINNGVDLTHFHPAESKAAAKSLIGLEPDALVVGTATRADPRKGMGTFLQVADALARRTPPTTFLIVGGASFPHEQEFYERVRKSAEELAANVVMTGIMDDPASAFQAMDIMVHSGELPESFGLTVTEAMACGVPVVGFDWGGLSEILVSGESGILVEPLNVTEMIRAVDQLLSNDDSRDEMGSAARERAEKLFDLNLYARRMQEVIQEVAKLGR